MEPYASELSERPCHRSTAIDFALWEIYNVLLRSIGRSLPICGHGAFRELQLLIFFFHFPIKFTEPDTSRTLYRLLSSLCESLIFNFVSCDYKALKNLFFQILITLNLRTSLKRMNIGSHTQYYIEYRLESHSLSNTYSI